MRAASRSLSVSSFHSQLNPTRVDRIVTPRSIEEIQETLRQAGKEGKSISITGARHAMGGQQFGEGTILIDMSRMNRVLRFDRTNGLVEAEAGIDWPGFVESLVEAQSDGASRTPGPDFLRLKKTYHPAEIFQSEWYRHYRSLADGAP